MKKFFRSISKKCATSQEFLHFIFLFKLSYYFCVTPFSISKGKDGKFKLHTNKIQKVLAIVLHGLVIVQSICNLIAKLKPVGSVTKDPSSLFEQITVIFHTIYPLVCFYVFWFNNKPLKKFLEASQKDSDANGLKIEKSITVLSVLVTLLWLIHQFDLIIYARYRGGFQNWVIRSDLNYFVGADVATLQYSDLSLESKILRVFYHLIEYYKYLVRCIMTLTILMSAIVFNDIAKKFSQFIERTEHVSQIYWNYRRALLLVKHINAFITPLLVTFVALSFCEHIHHSFEVVIIGGKSYPLISKLHYTVSFAQVFIVILVCAEGHRKMNSLTDWLTDFRMNELSDTENVRNAEEIKADQKIVDILKWESITNSIGIGFNSLLTITYSFLFTFMGVFATYAVIMLQFHSEHLKNDSTDSPVMMPPVNLGQQNPMIFPGQLSTSTSAYGIIPPDDQERSHASLPAYGFIPETPADQDKSHASLPAYGFIPETPEDQEKSHASLPAYGFIPETPADQEKSHASLPAYGFIPETPEDQESSTTIQPNSTSNKR